MFYKKEKSRLIRVAKVQKMSVKFQETFKKINPTFQKKLPKKKKCCSQISEMFPNFT